MTAQRDHLHTLFGPEHACLIYHDGAEHAEALATYLHAGLKRGERCVYVVDDHQPGAIYRALRHRGIEVDAAAARGALVIRGKRETYLRGGRFVPEDMMRFLESSVSDARNAGFRGLRVTGEMTWALDGATPKEDLLAYESMVDAAVPMLGVRGLCQYDARRFSPETLQAVRERHPVVYEGGLVRASEHYPR